MNREMSTTVREERKLFNDTYQNSLAKRHGVRESQSDEIAIFAISTSRQGEVKQRLQRIQGNTSTFY